VTQFLISAVKEAGAEGVFDVETVESMETRFRAHAKRIGKDDYILDARGFISVCKEIGIVDEGIVRALFANWDTDKSGTIEFSEFLHVLAFSRKTSAHDKLDTAFSLMDKDKDGQVTYGEMAAFFRTVYKAIGKPKTPSQIQTLVQQVFAKLDKDYSAAVDRPEFSAAAASVHLSTGDTLVTLMDAMMDRFGTIRADLARRHRSGISVVAPGDRSGARGAPLGASKSMAPTTTGHAPSVAIDTRGTEPVAASTETAPSLRRQPTRD
jgi:Ca2+-binding EF-hand superfamily protein